ncbi:Srb4p KNAG_0F03690 [Huiozyma naganishii CBS 8797]|uniref:Mediator of RNA polymerase II transcription subunit 17 n=1 Tax=Huiozyma naganishii (strain ATCC MYA-139 / BCRC 22969 / CBS 8797 / KCTC 17520 / NBRC 10181 / NCYC 3082 / Yp74L-3) TaxID=1071383 RepID=J7S8Q5_HUIN7|nr:hypothetical protein KNAG_0F03690 [Kazachstania naganishii CBS 8797]CCK71031.1 hypothetical protein KNAG_0F03690 [Kazachstania naganishii CBS 8797]
MSDEQGINLALDPNLITLPLNGSTGTTTTSPLEMDTAAGTDTTAKPKVSLVDNPHEMYGQMPLAQLVPLILQQRQIPFSQLLEQNIINSMSGDEQPFIPEEQTVDMAESGALNNRRGQDETFASIRANMVEQTNVALNEASLALETVALLLSATRESNAKASISPFLKNTVPLRSLNSDSVLQQPSEPLDDLKFALGWKLKCLDDCKNKLRREVDTLRATLEREHLYWRKIGQYIKNSDVVFKMRDKSTGLKAIALKFGYEDSGSAYRYDRGIAILRNRPESDMLELVPVASTRDGPRGFQEKLLRVRIFTKIASEEDYIFSGESTLQDNAEGSVFNNENIRGQISKLKDIIFEKELMYQLKRECAPLISYGVSIENENKVVMELPNEKFEIELVSCDESSMANHDHDNPRTNDRRANLFLITLRMLLIVQFKKNIRRGLAMNVSSSRRGPEDILLLRPLLAKLRHQNYKILLRMIIKDNFLEMVQGSTVEEQDNTPRDDAGTNSARVLDRHIYKLNSEIDAFNQLINYPSTLFTLKTATGEALTVSLELPNYCNAKIEVSYTSFHAKFSEFKEAEEFLHFLVNEYVNKSQPPLNQGGEDPPLSVTSR